MTPVRPIDDDAMRPRWLRLALEGLVVAASHVGLGMNPLALHAPADRLAQPEGGWRPFERHGLPCWPFADPARAQARGLPEAARTAGAAR
jgi:hypothetical protein